MPKAKKISKKNSKSKKIKKIPEGRGIIHLKYTFNNTHATLTKENGDVLKHISGGSKIIGGFKNTQKGLVHVAKKVVQEIIKFAVAYGVYNVSLEVEGISPSRNPATEEIKNSKDLRIEELIDSTPEQYGGCRPPKAPRK
jgi:ribosomal protein S11